MILYLFVCYVHQTCISYTTIIKLIKYVPLSIYTLYNWWMFVFSRAFSFTEPAVKIYSVAFSMVNLKFTETEV